MPSGVLLDGLQKALAKVRRMDPALKRGWQAEGRQIAEPARAEASAEAPRGPTGRLANIKTYTDARSIGVGIKGLDYAVPRMFQTVIGGRFGPRSNPRDPFLPRAVEAKRPDLIKRTRDMAARVLKGVFG